MRKTIEIGTGIALVTIGLIGGLIPVLQGWLFGVPGLIILARHFKWARRLLEWVKARWEKARGVADASGEGRKTG